jgi:small multidrug resistance pump
MPMTAILLVAGVAALSAAGDFFLKLASERQGALGSIEFVWGAACYAISAIGVLYALRLMPVSILGIWYALLSLLFIVALGILVFGEELRPREALGLVFACAAIILMKRLV